nr:D-alanyl-D-alanine carboxypeptidase/D-alanyl-D-alanine-endopeptidase [Fredinandcohnia sp. SECRCQ15]
MFAFIPYIHVERNTVLAIGEGKEVFQKLNQLIRSEPALEGAIAGISIRSATTGELLFEHNGHTRLRPASNLKLLTAATALSSLGETYTFETEVLTDGNVNDKKLEGNLYLKGKGDPTLLISDFEQLAKKIKDSGIEMIIGNLIADDTWYDDERYSIDLTWVDETTYYGSAVSALTASPNKDYDSGTVIITISPGNEINKEPTITIQPKNNYVKIINQAKTISSEGVKELEIYREHGSNTITIMGTIPINSNRTSEWISVWEPTGYALDLFKQSLIDEGIILIGEEGSGKTPESAESLVSHHSITLSELMIPFMKLSNNGHGETLVKEMGKVNKGEGSWDKGIEVMKNELSKLGVNPDQMVIRDGSGISHVNLISANDISYLLYTIQKEEWFPSYLKSMPIAGNGDKNIGGTMRNRLKSSEMNGKVLAKTGSIRTVSSLSGYITTRNGDVLVFSIILNNLIDGSDGKAIEDKIVNILFN